MIKVSSALVMVWVFLFGVVRPLDAALSSKREMPDFLGDRAWYGTKPLTKADLQGKVTLINFWNYSDAASLRNAAYLNLWNSHYADFGLQVIAFHTPEFHFEESIENFKEVFPYLGQFYAGALDSDHRIWNSFNVLDKPANFFIDARGRIRAVYYKEGKYQEQEKTIQNLIREFKLDLNQTIKAPPPVVDFSRSLAPDMLMGSRHNSYYGNPEKFRLKQNVKFKLPEFMQTHRYYLEGSWELHERFIRVTKSPSALIVKFKSNGAHIIATTRYQGISVDVDVLLDGYPINLKDAAKDVESDLGKSFLNIEFPRLYQLVDTHDNYEEKTLRLNFQQPGAEIYGISFGRITPFRVGKGNKGAQEDEDTAGVTYELLSG